MIISHSKKFLFFHMYKVAGTSITSLLHKNGGENHWEINGEGTPGARHTTCKQALEHNKYKELIKEYYTFCFVRNPWDWTLSNYLYAKSCSIHPQYQNINNNGISFEDYVEGRYCGTQFNFLSDKNGSLEHFDFIGKFENLNDDILFLAKKLNLKGNLSHQNKTEIKSGNYMDYYTEALVKTVEETCAKDIELFGYKFGE